MSLTESTVPAAWEHLRRYMNENGPPLQPGETLRETTLPQGWRQSLGIVSVFGPGWRGRWRESPWLMGLLHLLSPLMVPLGLAMATTHRLSCITAREVPWPQDILDRIGPALPTEQAQAAVQAQRARRGGDTA
ncbi:MAG: hypothetical protein IIZ92_04790 [Aquincola sp.]|mgnify:CR=1 FL=1|nr:hypothetical protein [Aquincola sp.]|tara:strand:+ start:668 stop:1066 length:399 start_codon:yes stop_codon:yes gene_type:complete